MNNPTESFIRLYEELKSEINRMANNRNSFSFELAEAASRHAAIRRHQNTLRYVNEIRTLLQHPKHKSQGGAIEITPSFLNEVADILAFLKNPPCAKDVGVARKDLRVARFDEEIGTLAREMKSKGFSHLPILDDRYVLQGVFNEAAIFDHLWEDDETIVSQSMALRDILRNCRIDADHTETFEFVRPTTPLDDLAEMFIKLGKNGTRIGAIFVTPSGKRSEPIHRIITAWDVLNASR